MFCIVRDQAVLALPHHSPSGVHGSFPGCFGVFSAGIGVIFHPRLDGLIENTLPAF